MTAHSWFTLVACGAIIGWGIDMVLAARQRRSVRAHRDRVPEAFADRVALPAHQKAADYTVVRSRFGVVTGTVELLLLGAWTLGGGLAWLDGVVAGFVADPLWQGALVVLAFSLLSSLIGLPAAVYSTFVIESRFGFNRTTVRRFVTDLVLQTIVSMVLLGPLVLLLLYLMQAAGPLWWVWGWGTFSAFMIGVMWAYPRFVAPLFNTFRTLDNESLRARIDALLTRVGFEADGVFVMDASRRSAHGNAYFTGLGRQKRIVFFDTLLKDLDDAEVEGVLAHELGHFKRYHIHKGLVTTLLVSGAAFFAMGALAGRPWFFEGLGVSASDHMTLLLSMLVLPTVSWLWRPITSWRSRRHEYEADAFAAEHASAAALKSALVKMYEENASTLTPDRWHSAYYDSHPPAPVRVAYLEQLAEASHGG